MPHIKSVPGHARRDRHVPDKSTDVRAQMSSFQNIQRMAATPEPRTTVIFLRTVASRWAYFFGRAVVKRARKRQGFS